MVSTRYKFSFPHVHFTKIDSTNKYLRENLSNISPLHGFMAISDFQTEGKGQYGRIWESDSQKNILCTTVLRLQFSTRLIRFLDCISLQRYLSMN
jgi:biotin-(acetyl-CoA carboxylase) ligase